LFHLALAEFSMVTGHPVDALPREAATTTWSSMALGRSVTVRALSGALCGFKIQ
jgi:hypothetical protein